MAASAVRPVAIKIDEDIKARVKRLAQARQRTPHWLMREAITQMWIAKKSERPFVWTRSWHGKPSVQTVCT